MTPDIERIANEAGLATWQLQDSQVVYWAGSAYQLAKFAALIAEDVIQTLDNLFAYTGGHGEPSRPSTSDIAAAIRAKFTPPQDTRG